jgi:hypothetical protein
MAHVNQEILDATDVAYSQNSSAFDLEKHDKATITCLMSETQIVTKEV